MRVHPLAPVVALDIDGTLGDYYEHMRWFSELYLQRPVQLDWTRTGINAEFSEALGLDKETYRQVKLAFRQGGMKRCLPAFPGVDTLSRLIREHYGCQLWIATTRPWMRLDNIDPDTQFWLKNKIGRVDGVIYGEDKYLDLVDIVGKERIVGVVDDLPENVVAAQALGLRAAVRVGDHNRAWLRSHPETNCVLGTSEMISIIERWVEDHTGKKIVK